MALTIEDGTGVTGADSHTTAAEFAAHEVEYFGAASAGDEATKEAALRRVFVYMAALEWKADTWPLFEGTIPDNLKRAQSILARSEMASAGVLSPVETISKGKVLNRVGRIGWDVKSAPATVAAARPVVTMAFDLLAPYLLTNPAAAGGGTHSLMRA